jgi:unsaturated rhamnogalacturonyl hydrolase
MKSLVSAGMVTGAFGLSTPGSASGRSPLARTVDPLLERVKLAMLTMQRHAWEQGVAAQALLELGEEDLVVLMAKEAVVRIWDDGRLGQVCDNHGVTDPGANGEAVLWAARKTGDPKLKAGADRMLDYFLHKAPRRKDGTLYHIDDKPQVWIDSMYMAPPFLAVAGQPEEALRQVEGLRKLLWNKNHKLFSHIWDDAKNDFGRKAFWGVGNGWAAAGMTRVLKALPESMPAEKKRLQSYIRGVLDGCLEHQRPDGLFHDVLDNLGSFVEVNLAQILAYTIYRGVKAGWLESHYRAKADRMRQATRTKVDGLGLVQDVCGSPTFEAPGTATEGQAFFLLMEAAAHDLTG